MKTLYEVTVYLKCADEQHAEAMAKGLQKICTDIRDKLPGSILEATITINKLEVME